METKKQIGNQDPALFSFLAELLADHESLKAAAEAFEMQGLIKNQLFEFEESVGELGARMAEAFNIQGAMSDQIVTLAEIVQDQSDTISLLNSRVADLEREIINQQLQSRG